MSPAPWKDRAVSLLPSAAVALVTALVFWPAGGLGFLDYDDVVYVTANPRVRAGLTLEGLAWALTSTDVAVNWHPLAWASHMLDVELFGLDPRGHHLSSVTWHALVAGLAYLFFERLVRSRPAAALGALGFALHPLRVEAVALVADRKDLVAAACGLAGLHAHLGWLRRGGAWRLAGGLAWSALGLAAKPTLLPWFALVALLGWAEARAGSDAAAPSAPRPLGLPGPRARRLAVVPHALLCLAAAVPTFAAQRAGGALSAAGPLPLTARLANACASFAAYLSDKLWPAGLAFFYPHPALVGSSSPPDAVAAGLALALALGVGARLALRRGAVWAAVGLVWFPMMLLPTLGLVQVGLQARADRYTYLPSLGLALALAAGLAAWRDRAPRSARVAMLALAALVCALAPAARAQLATWRDTRTVAERALAVTERNFQAHALLSTRLAVEGRRAESLAELQRSLALRPSAPIEVAAGQLALELADEPAALAHFRRALVLEPGWHDLALRLAPLLSRHGAEAEAVALLERTHAEAVKDTSATGRALELASGQALSWLLATSARDDLRDGARAEQLARTCLAQARSADGLDALAAAQAERGQFDEALRTIDAALALAPPPRRGALLERRAHYASGRPWRRP